MKTHYIDNEIAIRPYLPEDVDPVYKEIIASREHLLPYMVWLHDEYSKSDTQSFVSSRIDAFEYGYEFCFVIYNVNTNEIIGSVAINSIDHPHKVGELGYWIGKSFSGKGYATRACELALKFAFEQLKLNRIEVLVIEINKASLRVAEKVGAKYESRIKQRFYIDNKFVDSLMYVILAEDFEKQKPMRP